MEKFSLLNWAVLLNGLGLWAVAAAIVWTGHQPHTILLSGADPKHFPPVSISSDISGNLVLDSGAGGFAVDAGGTTLDVNANLNTPASGIDVNVGQK